MKKNFLFISLCFATTVLLQITACKKESFITSADAGISITSDTLRYDTVFTTIGSVTQSFKIINTNAQRLRLTKVQLAGGSASAFSININGIAGPLANNIDIAANDSIYVFVNVRVNPTAADLPFILQDSIAITYNGNTRFVQLEAYGQNAIFLRDKVLTGNTLFSSNKPYVVIGFLQVATGATLTLPAGTKIFVHANAPVIVDGTLIGNGTKNNEVVFTGDRRDAPYKNFPGTWPGIIFRATSTGNILTHTILINAFQAIVLLTPFNTAATLVLTMQQCTISNASDAGIVAFNSSIAANNCLIYNCGANVSLLGGGRYNFTNCTLAAYSTQYLQHNTAVLSVTNNLNINGNTLMANLDARFTNSIMVGANGTVTDEITTDRKGNNAFTFVVENCIYKAATDPANTTTVASKKNADPLFDSIDVANMRYNFRISSAAAPGINAGRATLLTKDLDDKNRTVGITDIGCYEKQ